MKLIKACDLKIGDIVVDNYGAYLVNLVESARGGFDVYYSDGLVEWIDESSMIKIKHKGENE